MNLFYYLNKLSDKEKEALKLEKHMECNWIKRIFAFFGYLAFGLFVVIFLVCMLALVIDTVYIAVCLIELVIFILCGIAKSSGYNYCDMLKIDKIDKSII